MQKHAHCASFPFRERRCKTKTTFVEDVSQARYGGISKRSIVIGMKLTATLLITAFLNVSAAGVSQTITLSGKQVALETIFSEVEKQAGLLFFYETDMLKESRPMDIKAYNLPVKDFLDKVFKDLPLEFLIENKVVIVSRKLAKVNSIASASPQFPPPPVEIRGVVSNESGEPLSGVSVAIKNTSRGTTTSENGTFIIMAKPQETLEFSMVGFQTYSVKINKTNDLLKITLVQDVSNLSDVVVVVGYGTQKKTNVTGAIEVVNKKMLAARPQGNLSQLLQGVSPGLNVSTNNSGGEPDATMNLNIRGMGTPFILVDGMPMNINQINPSDVESVSILKDASSAAIYGANAPYGVVLITTKKGRTTDGKPSLTYNSDIAITSPTLLPKPANSLEFANSWNDATANSGMAPFFSPEVVERIKQYMADPENTTGTVPDPLDPNKWGKHEYANANTNWYDVLVKKWAFRQKHNITLDGGKDAISYYLSTGFYDQQGQMRYGDEQYERYNIDAKVSSKVTSWMQMNFLAKYARSTSDYPNDGYGLVRNVMWHDLPRRYATDPVKYPNGEYSEMSRINIYEKGGRDTYTNNELWLRLEGALEPVKNWLIKGDYSWKNANSINTAHHAVVYAHGPNNNPYVAFDTRTPNDLAQTFDADNYWTYNVSTSYEKKIGNHQFKLLLGHQREYQKFNSLYGLRNRLITDYVPSLSTATGDVTVRDNLYHWSTTGTFFRFNYDFQEKYLLEVNARRNGTSKFGEGSRYGFFPSVSLGYKLSDERFWSPIKSYVNYLKLRASYGSLGNHNVANYLYLPIMPVTQQVSWIMGDIRPIGVQPQGLTSPFLTWETVRTFDIGWDAALLNNRLEFTFDYFKRTVLNMLGTSYPLPSVLGTTVPLENNAEKQNVGWEASFGWNDRIGKDFSYNVRATISDYKVKITKWNNPQKNLSVNYDGLTEGDIWGYESDGLFQNNDDITKHASQNLFFGNWYPGDVKYNDLNGDGVINQGNNTVDDHGDLKIIGNSLPRYSYAVSAGFAWKNIDMSMFWMGISKRDVWFSSGSNVFWGQLGDVWQNSTFKEHLDYWREDNTSGYYPRPYFSGEGAKNRQVSSLYLQKAAFLRLKSLQLGYTLPQSFISRLSIKKARIYFNGENLITFSPIKEMFDPEGIAGTYGQGKIYPLSKIISFGLSVNF